MEARINKLIVDRGYKSYFCICFAKSQLDDTNLFNNKKRTLITSSQPKLSRSLNKTRAIDLTRTSGASAGEHGLRKLHEFCVFDEKRLLLENKHDSIFTAMAIQRCLP
jgi:hypothetical protein